MKQHEFQDGDGVSKSDFQHVVSWAASLQLDRKARGNHLKLLKRIAESVSWPTSGLTLAGKDNPSTADIKLGDWKDSSIASYASQLNTLILKPACENLFGSAIMKLRRTKKGEVWCLIWEVQGLQTIHSRASVAPAVEMDLASPPYQSVQIRTSLVIDLVGSSGLEEVAAQKHKELKDILISAMLEAAKPPIGDEPARVQMGDELQFVFRDPVDAVFTFERARAAFRVARASDDFAGLKPATASDIRGAAHVGDVDIEDRDGAAMAVAEVLVASFDGASGLRITEDVYTKIHGHQRRFRCGPTLEYESKLIETWEHIPVVEELLIERLRPRLKLIASRLRSHLGADSDEHLLAILAWQPVLFVVKGICDAYYESRDAGDQRACSDLCRALKWVLAARGPAARPPENGIVTIPAGSVFREAGVARHYRAPTNYNIPTTPEEGLSGRGLLPKNPDNLLDLDKGVASELADRFAHLLEGVPPERRDAELDGILEELSTGGDLDATTHFHIGMSREQWNRLGHSADDVRRVAERFPHLGLFAWAGSAIENEARVCVIVARILIEQDKLEKSKRSQP